MPAEIVHPLRQRLDHLGRGGAGLREVEADAAHAELVHALELGVGDARSTTATARAVGPNAANASSVARCRCRRSKAARRRCGWCRCASGTAGNPRPGRRPAAASRAGRPVLRAVDVMWQSQALAGALSFGGSVPADHLTCCAAARCGRTATAPATAAADIVCKTARRCRRFPFIGSSPCTFRRSNAGVSLARPFAGVTEFAVLSITLGTQ